MKKRPSRVHLRVKYRLWRRRRYFRISAMSALAAALAAGLWQASSRLDFHALWPARGVEFQTTDSFWQAMPWFKEFEGEWRRRWTGRNRLWCLIDGPKLIGLFRKRYPYFEDCRYSAAKLLVTGMAQVAWIPRKPAAVFEELGESASCLDVRGLPFDCPPGYPIDGLVKISKRLEPGFVYPALAALPGVRQAFGSRGEIASISSLGGDSVVFNDTEGRRYEFSLADLNPDRRNAILDRWRSILSDLDAKDEKFSYIDLTLAYEGRVFVDAQPAAKNSRSGA